MEERVRSFLAEVSEIIPLGVSDHLDVRRVVYAAGETLSERELTALRSQLSAVLARNPEELAQISQLFDRCILGHSAAQPRLEAQRRRVAKPPARRWTRYLPLLAAFAILPLGAAIFAKVISRGSAEGGAFAETGTTRVPAAQPISDEARIVISAAKIVRMTEYESALGSLSPWNWTLALALAFFAFRALLVSYFAAREKRRGFQSRMETAKHERRAFAEEAARQGRPRIIAYQVPRYQPLSHADLTEIATRLSRMYDPHKSAELDPERTVQATIDAGGRFVPVEQQGHGRRQLLALVDVEASAHPWLGGIERILDALGQLGVPIVRYDFRFRLHELEQKPNAGRASLEEVTRRHSAACILLISRQLDPWRFDNEVEDWLQRLNTFPRAAWIDPDPSPLVAASRRWRAVALFEEHGLPRFPCTAEGWLSMARYLSSSKSAVPDVTWPTLPSSPAAAEALRAWAVTAALVPDATWDQLEAIRRSPDFPEIGRVFNHWHHLQCLLQWVESETHQASVSGDGRSLAVPDRLVKQLLQGQRRQDQLSEQEPLELRARKLLLSQLESTCPRDDSWGALCWKLKRVTHELVVDPIRASASIDALIGTAVEPMLLDVLSAEMELEAGGYHAPDRTTAKLARSRLEVSTGQGENTALSTLLFEHQRISLAAIVATFVFAWLMWTLRSHWNPQDVWIQLPEVLAPSVTATIDR